MRTRLWEREEEETLPVVPPPSVPVPVLSLKFVGPPHLHLNPVWPHMGSGLKFLHVRSRRRTIVASSKAVASD